MRVKFECEPYPNPHFEIPVALLTDKGNPRAKLSFALNHWVPMAARAGHELSTGTVEDVDDSATVGQRDL
jgi:hypothetical protein